jgi:hypothetical protein
LPTFDEMHRDGYRLLTDAGTVLRSDWRAATNPSDDQVGALYDAEETINAASAVLQRAKAGLLTDLGLDDAGKDLVLKPLAAIAPAPRERAEHARARCTASHPSQAAASSCSHCPTSASTGHLATTCATISAPS